ncbi:MAG: hypothetical protein JF620_00035 [Mesorhizobium sp.]|nr:hypothetical protein [Mesorhizobium sp.]
MARGIGIGDEVAITATVRRRVDEDHVSVSIPSYNFPHSIVDRSTNVKCDQQIELVGNDIEKVRLVQAYVPPKRKKPLRDMVD